jgi:hypothetical protein
MKHFGTISCIEPAGIFTVEHWRSGRFKDLYNIPNEVTNEARNNLLDINFHSATTIINWWTGLIDNTGYTSLAVTDTYENINQIGNGWAEFVDYADTSNNNSATTRPLWIRDPTLNQSITNTTKTLFDITASGTIKGVFLVGGIASSQIKSDHSAGNVLFATALSLSGDIAVVAYDQLRVTYTIVV